MFAGQQVVLGIVLLREKGLDKRRVVDIVLSLTARYGLFSGRVFPLPDSKQ